MSRRRRAEERPREREGALNAAGALDDAVNGTNEVKRPQASRYKTVVLPQISENLGKANKLVKQVSKLFRIKLFELC